MARADRVAAAACLPAAVLDLPSRDHRHPV